MVRDPLLVFCEGEYGVTDILYAAARSKNSEVFQVLIDFSLWSKVEKVGSIFKLEMMNRVVHAAARDVQGNTLLHSASRRCQTQVLTIYYQSLSTTAKNIHT
ncbi:hypothetical protein Hanom_Chr12g01083461 [Helianthus anomalus]